MSLGKACVNGEWTRDKWAKAWKDPVTKMVFAMLIIVIFAVTLPSIGTLCLLSQFSVLLLGSMLTSTDQTFLLPLLRHPLF